jgi:hypothetical protein
MGVSTTKCPGTFANFANYDATYGSGGAAISTMMWMWISTIMQSRSSIRPLAIPRSASRNPLARAATMADAGHSRRRAHRRHGNSSEMRSVRSDMIGAVSRQQPADKNGGAKHRDELGAVAIADGMNHTIDRFIRCTFD